MGGPMRWVAGVGPFPNGRESENPQKGAESTCSKPTQGATKVQSLRCEVEQAIWTRVSPVGPFSINGGALASEDARNWLAWPLVTHGVYLSHDPLGPLDRARDQRFRSGARPSFL